MLTAVRRNLRLVATQMRLCLIREMAFRGSFIVFALTEAFWLTMLLVFFDVVFGRTASVAGWSHGQITLLLGTHYVVTRLFQGLFFESCIEFSELVRSGKLDFLLLKPADTQLLVSFARIDYSGLVNVLFGVGLVAWSCVKLELRPGPADVALYLLLVGAGVTILYSLLFILSSTAVWAVRTQFIYEGWFHLTSFGRYPEGVFRIRWLRWTLTYVVPVLVVANWPARVLLTDDPDKPLDRESVLFAVAAAVVLLFCSVWVFRRALRSYQGAGA